MSRKKVDPEFAVVEEPKAKVPKFPIHENEAPFVKHKLEDGSEVMVPSDAYCSVKVKRFYADGSGIYAYEVVAKPFERIDMTQWVRGKKWSLVGYINPFTYVARFDAPTKFLLDSVPVLVQDIKVHESFCKQVIANGGSL